MIVTGVADLATPSTTIFLPSTVTLATLSSDDFANILYVVSSAFAALTFSESSNVAATSAFSPALTVTADGVSIIFEALTHTVTAILTVTFFFPFFVKDT